MKPLVALLVDLPERLARYFLWFGPLAARITVGYVFMWSGWEKLHALPQITQNFVEWGIPYPQILTPFTSGAEFVFGILLMLGLLTRIAGVGLMIVMIVAIISAKLGDIDSLETFLGFDETLNLLIFGWLAINGPGPISLDYLLQRMVGSKPAANLFAPEAQVAV